MATRLQNLTREPRTYILHAPGEEATERLPKVKAAVAIEKHDPKTGNRSTSMVHRHLPASITLQPKGIEGDTLDGLQDEVLYVPEIARDAKAGKIAVATLPSSEAPPATSPPDTPTDPALSAPPATARKGRKED